MSRHLRHADLSPRQFQVLLLLADGFQEQGIADEMLVSLSTARKHKAELFERLGARTSGQAVAEGFRRGLLAVDAEDVIAA